MNKTRITLQISGMRCLGCQRAVERELMNVDGVTGVSMNYPHTTRAVVYAYEDVNVKDLCDAVVAAGFTAVEIPDPEEKVS